MVVLNSEEQLANILLLLFLLYKSIMASIIRSIEKYKRIYFMAYQSS